MKVHRKGSKIKAYRPSYMRIDEVRCTQCDACFDIAPVIAEDTQRIPVTPGTLDAMAECPTGAIVWCEAGEGGGKEDG